MYPECTPRTYMKFTDMFLKSLKPQIKRYVVNEGQGFLIRVSPTGNKTFYIRYKYKGKGKKLSLGDYPMTSLATARIKYGEYAKLLHEGIDPAAPPSPLIEETKAEDITISVIAEKYIEWSEKHHSKEWHSITKSTINKHIIPNIGNRSIASIRKRDAIALMEHIGKSGDGAALNALKIARGIFEYAAQREFIDTSPFTKLARAVPSLAPKERQRILSDTEIKKVWEGVISGVGSPEVIKAILLVLLTAQRPGECSGISSEEIEGDWWTIPAARAQKGKRDHRVFLTKTAKLLIGDKPGYAFPSPRLLPGDDSGVIFTTPKIGPITPRALPQLITRKDKFYGLERWTPHDLRRTARTLMARIGIREEEAEAVLNHAKQGVVKIYNLHQYDNEKRLALIKLEKEILKIVGKEGQSLLKQLCGL